MLFWKIVKIVTTRCQILWLKCTKIDFGWGYAPDPAGGAYSAPPDPLAGFKGPTSQGNGGERGKGRRGEGRGWGARPVCLLVFRILATGLSGQIVGNCIPLPFLAGERRSPSLHDRYGWTQKTAFSRSMTATYNTSNRKKCALNA